MKFTGVSLLFAAAGYQACAAPVPRAENPPYFVLVGDSTVAVRGGWGDGFLPTLQASAAGINSGKSGATTVSYRAAGLWDGVLSAVAAHSKDYRPIVTIQFGHNDQKAEAGISLEQFTTNLQNMANEVKSAGGTPVRPFYPRVKPSHRQDRKPPILIPTWQILITSLTRRNFSGGKVKQDLEDQRNAAIAAAKAVGAQWLDLNIASVDYINAIGQENAEYYNLSEGDRTHLNTKGEIVFGRMVADLMVREREDLRPYFKENKALSDKIWAGEFATGDE